MAPLRFCLSAQIWDHFDYLATMSDANDDRNSIEWAGRNLVGGFVFGASFGIIKAYYEVFPAHLGQDGFKVKCSFLIIHDANSNEFLM